jgi:anhydro-N-acetylmuramic acid kinase
LGEVVLDFVHKHKLSPDFIASHGHTVYHMPSNGLTFQFGDGAEIAAASGLQVVCDFRSTDIALGGQGAPLVPIGDKYLFGNYTYCLNLGGIANISFDKYGKRRAFDICPCNIPLNKMAAKFDMLYDDKGAIAASGKVNSKLLDILNDDAYYSQSPPKSLDGNWAKYYFMRMVDKSKSSNEDKMRTICEHIAMQISAAAPYKKGESMLVTGGGAYNTFLMERIKALCPAKVIIPDNKTVEFKEALIFAFLGVLRMRGEINCLSSVTGARKDSIGGAVYLGWK